MLDWFDTLLNERPRWVIASLTLVMIAFLGSVDQLTGNEISFSVFYLVPTAISAWYGSRLMGFFASGLSAATWLMVERLSTVAYSQQWILYWNSAVRFLFFVVVAWLAAELRVILKQQQKLARTDNLTGLLNRAGFITHAEKIIAAASRYRQATAFAYIDLDGFKRINDTQGHSRGDDVLRAIGLLLDGSSRESDLVARLGGDEFAVLLSNTGFSGARAFFNHLHERLQGEADALECPGLGFSIGAIVFEAGPPSLDDALRQADALMYHAKRTADIVVEVAKTADAASSRPAVGDA